MTRAVRTALSTWRTCSDCSTAAGNTFALILLYFFVLYSVVYVVTMKKFSCVAKPPDNMNIGGGAPQQTSTFVVYINPFSVDSEVTTFLIENINALSATTTQLPPSIMSKSFNEQIFDLPESMPAVLFNFSQLF